MYVTLLYFNMVSRSYWDSFILHVLPGWPTVFQWENLDDSFWSPPYHRFSVTIGTAVTSAAAPDVLPVRYLYHWIASSRPTSSQNLTVACILTSHSVHGPHVPSLQQHVTVHPTTLPVAVSIIGVVVFPFFPICTQFSISSHQLSWKTPIRPHLLRFHLSHVRD